MYLKNKILIILLFLNINYIFSETVIKSTEPTRVQKIKLQKDIVNMKINRTEEIHYEIEPKSATYNDISWESSNENVVSVKDGIISSFEAGEAYIFIRCDKITTKFLVKVKEQQKFQETIWYHLLIALGPILIAIISLIFGYRNSKVKKKKEIIEKIQDKLINLLNILYDIEEKATNAINCEKDNIQSLRNTVDKLISETNKTDIYISLMATIFNKTEKWDFSEINEYIYGSFNNKILYIFKERVSLLNQGNNEDNVNKTVDKLSELLYEANNIIANYFRIIT